MLGGIKFNKNNVKKLKVIIESLTSERGQVHFYQFLNLSPPSTIIKLCLNYVFIGFDCVYDINLKYVKTARAADSAA